MTQDIESEDSLRPSSSSTTTTTTTTTWLQPLASTSTHMKRSDSSTSLGTTAVEDSSLMKRAYQKYEQQQQHIYSIGLLDAYFTLHTGHLNAPEFYKSEMIPNTINPTFRALAFPFDWMNWYDAASSLLVIRVWTRHAIPESAGLHTEPVLGYQKHCKQDDGFELLIEWQLDLNALAWIGKKASEYHPYWLVYKAKEQCSFQTCSIHFPRTR
jgi:hypothetical protein